VHHIVVRRLVAVCLSLAAWLAVAVPAGAADRIFWSNYGNDTLGFANFDGSGGAPLTPTGATVATPRGTAINAEIGRLYWVNEAGSISWSNLDGTSGSNLVTTPATVNAGSGLAIDPNYGTRGRLYWANASSNKIGFANANNSGGGYLDTTGATVSTPAGVAIDPASNRIYWANVGANKISYANLDGSGGGADLATTGATVNVPEGVALDVAAGRIYWANQSGDKISFARLDGSGGGDLVTTGATVAHPTGVAIDPVAGRIYWGNFSVDHISYAALDGSGGGDLPVGAAAMNTAIYPALLRAPVPAGVPVITGDKVPGSGLFCSRGSWGPDLLGSLLFRVPASYAYQWTLDGADIGGATSSSYTAFVAGDYRCRVTASNAAGDATQTSDVFTVTAPPDPRTPQPPLPSPSGSDVFGLSALVSLKVAATRIPARGPLKVVVANANGFAVKVRIGGRTAARIRASAKRVVAIKPVSATVAANAKRTVSLRLPKAIQRELKRKRALRLVLTGSAADPGSHTRTLSKRVTVKLKR
jgi:low density lipoprotein receptor-related protein 5/6